MSYENLGTDLRQLAGSLKNVVIIGILCLLSDQSTLSQRLPTLTLNLLAASSGNLLLR